MSHQAAWVGGRHGAFLRLRHVLHEHSLHRWRLWYALCAPHQHEHLSLHIKTPSGATSVLALKVELETGWDQIEDGESNRTPWV